MTQETIVRAVGYFGRRIRQVPYLVLNHLPNNPCHFIAWAYNPLGSRLAHLYKVGINVLRNLPSISTTGLATLIFSKAMVATADVLLVTVK